MEKNYFPNKELKDSNNQMKSDEGFLNKEGGDSS